MYVFSIVVDFVRSSNGHQSNHCQDILVGSLPNVNSVLFGSVLIYTIFYGSKKDAYPIGYTGGVILYEFLQIFINDRTFDYYGLLGSLVGYILFFLIFKRSIDFLMQNK